MRRYTKAWVLVGGIAAVVVSVLASPPAQARLSANHNETVLSPR